MRTSKPIGRSDALGDFLAVRGLTTQWLIEQCEELPSDAEAASTVLEILANLVKSGIALPPVAADMVSAVLLALASGNDARALVGTAPTRGRPASDSARDKRDQAGACLALMNMAGIERQIAVKLLASSMPMAEREVEDILMPEIAGSWNHQAFLMEMGGTILEKLLTRRLGEDSNKWRAKFIEFCSVTPKG